MTYVQLAQGGLNARSTFDLYRCVFSRGLRHLPSFATCTGVSGGTGRIEGLPGLGV